MRKEIIYGSVFVILLSAGIMLQFTSEEGIDVKFRLDVDKSTFYVKNENNRFIVAGREYNKLRDWPFVMNRRVSEIKNFTFFEDGILTYYRITPYIRGPLIIDTYEIDSRNTLIERFPSKHEVRVINGSGFLYQYEVRDLKYDGPTMPLTGTSFDFGNNIKVEWDPGYSFAKVYKSGILKIRYKLESDDEVFNVRLFDPVIEYSRREGGRILTLINLTTADPPITIYDRRFGIVGTGQDDTEDEFGCEGDVAAGFPCGNAVDEDLDTYANLDGPSNTYNVSENFTIPDRTVKANWTLKYRIADISLYSACWTGSEYSTFLTGSAASIRTDTAAIPTDCLTGEKLQMLTVFHNPLSLIDGKYYEANVTWIDIGLDHRLLGVGHSTDFNVSFNVTTNESATCAMYLSNRTNLTNQDAVLHFTFDKNETDLSPHSHPASLSGGVKHVNNSYFKGGFEFDGVDGFIDAGSNSVLRPGAWTVEAWVKPNRTGTRLELVGFATSTLPYVAIHTTTLDRPAIIMDGSNYVYFTHHAWFNVSDGDWHHVAFTMPNSSNEGVTGAKMYVDGVSYAQTIVISSQPQDSKNYFYIGRRGSTPSYYSGALDELIFWNRSLSQQEIIDHMNYGVSPDMNYSMMIKLDSDRQCSGSGTEHLCTPASFDNASRGVNTALFACIDSNSHDEALSLSGPVYVSVGPIEYVAAQHPNLTTIDYAANFSKILDQVNFSQAGPLAGNFSWNFSELNLEHYLFNFSTGNTTNYVFNFSNNDSLDMEFFIKINNTEDWFKWYCNGVEIITEFGKIADVPNGTHTLINCTLDLINISQTYVNWNISVNKAVWNFHHNITAAFGG